jgi:uncharacterized protein YjbI with pentapeptide repeats
MIVMGIYLNAFLILLLILLIPCMSLGNCSNAISSEDIKIQLANNEQIEYNNKIINGDIALDSKRNEKNIKSKIYISNSLINGRIGLQKTIFSEAIIFDNATFGQIVDFTGSSFRNNVTFRDCKFKNVSLYDNCNFEKLVEFKNTEFSENASFEKSKFADLNIKRGLFNKSANFKDTQFNDSIELKYSNFKNVDFSNSNLRNSSFESTRFANAVFYQAKFYGETSFNNAEIDNGYFSESEFHGDTYFNYLKNSNAINFPSAIFHRDFYFQDSKINVTNFKEAQFVGDASFQSGEIKRLAKFEKAKFIKDAHFYGVNFSGDEAIFIEAGFSRDADFDKAKFLANSTNFAGAEFGKDGGLAKFKGANFANNVTFLDSIFHKDAYFSKAKFFGAHTNFDNADFEEDAFFEDISIRGLISLTKTKYKDIYIRFNDIANKLDYNDEAYLKLIKNFNDQALFYDADKLYYEYRTKYRAKGWDSSNANERTNLTMINITSWIMAKSDKPFRKYIDTVLDISYAYGTEPIRPFYYSLFIIITFAALWRGIGFRKKFYVEKFQSNDEMKSVDIFVRTIINEINREKDSLIFSILLFLSGTRLFVDPPKLPGFPAKSSRLASIMYFSERILGALFLALLLISISKTIIRSPTNLI